MGLLILPDITESVSSTSKSYLFPCYIIELFNLWFLEDIPFGQVKLGELAAWFGRRNKTPTAVASAIGRGKIDLN